MVRVHGPMMSLDASGTLAGTVVFSKWKGRNYVRERVTPANPKSGGQVGMRAMLKFLSQNWAALSAANKATWEDRADAGSYSPFNAYTSYNQKKWRDFTSPSTEDPAAGVGTIGVLANEAATAGVRSITLDIDITTSNDNWGIAVFRGLAPAFSTAWDNLIGIIPAAAIASYVLVDTPLTPDTYYYNFRAITEDGVMGADHGEVNAIVT